MTVAHVCITFLLVCFMFWTWWSTAIKVHECVKDLSKVHENRLLAMKAWTYYRRNWNASFLDSRKLSWNSLLLDSRELIHWLPLNHRKWGFVADNYLYFLEDIWMSVDFNIFVLKDNLFIDKMYFIKKLEYLADLSCWVWHCFLCLQWASGSWIKDSAMYPDKILAACSPKLKQSLTHFLFSFFFFPHTSARQIC